jgi:hypothetical protein
MPLAQPDFRGTRLAGAINVVRQRLALNRWLRISFICLNWTLLAAILVVAFVRSMRVPLILTPVVAACAVLATAIVIWSKRPSNYRLAQELDSQSHSGDRISTAVYFWDMTDASGVILRQRDDALARVAKVEPRELFPLQMPARYWQTAVLIAAFGAVCVYHAAYGPPILNLKEKAVQSRALATVVAPLTRALELARGEKKELADLIAGNDRDKQASDKAKPFELPAAAEPTGAAKAVANPAEFDMGQAMQMAANANAAQNQMAKTGQAGQQAGVPANSQSASTDNAQGQPSNGAGQQSLGEKALQALENLMSSAMSGQQGSSQSPASSSPVNNPGATSAQAMSGSTQMASSPNQAAQGQTSNSQGSQNPSNPMQGKHTGAGNGSSPWQPRDAADKDPTLAGNMAKEHVDLQVTGFRGPPGKERADVAPGTAQIPLQNVAPQAVTTVNGAGQDSVPPRYRQYVQNYFQHSEK